MTRDLTTGGELRSMLLFSLPLICGNLLQQLYNVVDTLIVGRVLGSAALAAVGASYTLMAFLTSVILGFCMGGGVVFAHLFGAGETDTMRAAVFNAFCFTGVLTAAITASAYLLLEPLLLLLRVQPQVMELTALYLRVVCAGIPFTFLYNFLASVLRSVGNSLTPLLFLGAAALVNIALDILFVLPLQMGVAGAAAATVIAQALSAAGILLYGTRHAAGLLPAGRHMRLRRDLLRAVAHSSVLTSIQQSVMNFGILLVQGLVNSFGVAVTAAFAAAVKIDTFAYMPVQDFGNAFSTYVAQNHGAGKGGRIRRGARGALAATAVFCLGITALVTALARPLMTLFVRAEEAEIIAIGVGYLRVEGVFYCLIGCLFLLYGFYRGIGRPGISLLLTVVSLGSRVLLSHLLAPVPGIGLWGIWWSIPIGWLLADATGLVYYKLRRDSLLADADRQR